jgi:predicted metalloprotease with PDZ domain
MKRVFLAFFLPLLLAAQDVAPPVAVAYTLDATDPKSGAVKIEMSVENNRADEVTLGIPVWMPGRYRVVAHYLGVSDLEAEVAGKKVEVASTDHRSLWKVKTGGASKFTVRYTLKPNEVRELRGNLSEDHFDLQGPAVWLFVQNGMNGPHKATFKLPAGWRVGTGLKKTGEATYEAPDYDTFIDCPTELGKFSLETFTQDGVTYELVVHATGPFEASSLVDVHRKFIAEQTRIFGGAPFDRYVFLYHFNAGFGGSGLEHLNSTHITFPLVGVKDDPARIASLSSHEFFHLWNVKRIRPKELGPFDYTQPVRSKALWLSEGVTSYYGDLSLVRAGVWTREVYLAHLASQITTLQANPARKTQSVEEASRTVFDRPYRSRGASVDYYNKGELLGWLLDLKIRHATEGRKSFDDVMRHLYRVHVVEPAKAGRGAIGVGFEEGGILKAVNEVTGLDFTDYFTKYVSGTEELPYAEVVRPAGLSVGRQKVLGVVLRDMKVSVEPPDGSEAKKAGLRRGDELLKVNDAEIDKKAPLAKLLDPYEVGEVVTLTVARPSEKDPVRVEIKITEGPFTLKPVGAPSAEQAGLLKGWLSPSK